MQMFSAKNLEAMADLSKLEATVRKCHAADYNEEYHYNGFFLMLMIDDEPEEVSKNFWRIIGPDGKEHSLPKLLDQKRSFTYRKPTYEQFQTMVQSIKFGEKS